MTRPGAVHSYSERARKAITELVAHAGAPCTLLLADRLSDSALDALMAVPHVVSVVVDGPDDLLARRFPDRIGWFLEGQRDFVLPNRVARELIYVGHPRGFGFRAGRRAWRRGARWFRCSGDPAHLLKRRWMGAVLASALARSILYTMGRRGIWWPLEWLLSRRIGHLAHRLPHFELGNVEHQRGRIIFAVGSLGPGGSERQIVNTLSGLDSRGGMDLTLLHTMPMQPPHDFYRGRLASTFVDIVQLDPLHLRSPSEWATDPHVAPLAKLVGSHHPLGSEIIAYVLAFRERRPGVVHAWLDAINVTAGIAAVIAGVPRIVLSCRSSSPRHFQLYEPYMAPSYHLLARCPRVTLLNNSIAGARDYERWLGIKSGVVRVIYNGIDFSEMPPRDLLAARRVEYRRRVGISETAFVVGTVIRLSEEKQPLLWLEASANVARRNPSAEFLLVGDGPLREEVEKAARRLALTGRLRIVGHERDALSAMAAMDVFLLTSRMEGLPNVLIEAQALGLPVVAVSAGGVPETYEEGITGIGIVDADASHLADAIMRFATDPALRATACEQAPELVRERFGIDRLIRQTMAVYAESAQ